jgi:DNA-binding transcriptional MocR family regulator
LDFGVRRGNIMGAAADLAGGGGKSHLEQEKEEGYARGRSKVAQEREWAATMRVSADTESEVGGGSEARPRKRNAESRRASERPNRKRHV